MSLYIHGIKKEPPFNIGKENGKKNLKLVGGVSQTKVLELREIKSVGNLETPGGDPFVGLVGLEFEKELFEHTVMSLSSTSHLGPVRDVKVILNACLLDETVLCLLRSKTRSLVTINDVCN